jgi:hypothetical protein
MGVERRCRRAIRYNGANTDRMNRSDCDAKVSQLVSTNPMPKLLIPQSTSELIFEKLRLDMKWYGLISKSCLGIEIITQAAHASDISRNHVAYDCQKNKYQV